MNVLWLILTTIALAVLQGLVFHHFNFKRLSYERYFDRLTAFEGDRVELIETLRNFKRLPVPWLRAESRIPVELAFEKEKLDAHEVSGGLYHKSIFFLGAMSRVTRHHEVTLKRRGVYGAGSVFLTAGDLFSIARVERQKEIQCEIMVYPRILPDEELPDPANRWLGEAVVKRWIMPDPFLVTGIRDYRAGDSLRDIHWRASARTGDMRVKVRDYTSDPRVMVILNIQTSEGQWSDVSGLEEGMMEYAIRVAATLLMRAIRHGMDAGFASNACDMDKIGTGETVFVPSAGGGVQAERLLTALARIMLHRELNFHTFLEGLEGLCGEDLLILSFYESEDIHRRMDALRQAGNTVSLVKLARREAA